MELKERCKKLIEAFDLPISRLCRKLEISRTAYYDWQNGKYELKPEKLARIEEFLGKNNF